MTVRRCYMENRQDIINDILGELKQETNIAIDLPSKGLLYDYANEEDRNVYIRPMTFEDEKTLANSKKGAKDPINLLLERCVSNINVLDLYLFDKLYILMKLREISYGNTYDSIIVCPKCSAEAEISILIDKLPVDFVDDNFTDPIEIELPVIKKVAKVKLPKVRDEKYFSNVDNLGGNLWRFILEINGVSDETIISEVVNKLPLVDTKTIIKNLDIKKGIKTKIHYECDSCGGGSIIDLPINENFFNVN